MKKYYTLFLFCNLSIISFSQTTLIPDANFEQKLIDLGIDTNGLTGNILNLDAQTITDLDVSDSNISDLSGINAFTTLTNLNCKINSLTSLDVTQNTTLEILECSVNNLTSLDVTLNVNLIDLRVGSNSIEFLDLKQNPLLTIFIATNSPTLNCIQVANETDANADSGIYANWIFTAGASYSEFCSDFYTYVPNNNFEQALIDLGYDSLLDDYVLTSNIELITSLDVNRKSISDLTGIEDFVALQNLQCANNGLTNLDVTQNIGLINLRCYQNSLTSLDVTQNTLLTELRCGTNSISNLDISQNTALTSLRVHNNLLNILDITSNTALEILYTYNNNLEELDLIQNTLLTDMNATLNTNLTCIQVLDETAATANSGIYATWLKDIGASYATNCNYPQETYVPDDNFEQALIDLGYDSTLDDYVLTSNIELITSLDVSGKSISDLTGIEDFIALQNLQCANNGLINLDITQNVNLIDLRCYQNSLTSLDVTQNNLLTDLRCGTNSINNLDISQNTALTSLRVHNNLLSVLDITSNTALETLYMYNNNITEIDVSQNTGLNILDCSFNNLTSLDVSLTVSLTTLTVTSNSIEFLNLKQNTLLTHLTATNNAALSCIAVANETDANAGTGIYALWNKDTGSSYAEFCSNIHTNIPDNNFEQALIDLGYDSILDGHVLTSNIESITYLDVSGKLISDLTGIEGFNSLGTLNCNSNNIQELDLSQNTLLANLDCSTNLLTSLDVTQNSLLVILSCYNNQLTSLNVIQNLLLTSLTCTDNSLTSLDVSQNTALEVLDVTNNDLTSLDVTLNVNLITLGIHSNYIESLDLRQNTSLSIFLATNNTLLSCIAVANETDANAGTGIYTNWNKDPGTSYAEFCSNLYTYVPDDNFEQALIDLGYDTGALDDYVPTANITTVTSLSVGNKNINDLTGIEDFTALEELICSINSLTSLDVSQNTALTVLYCNFNSLASLNLSQNTLLETLYLYNNQLTSLDLSQNIALTTVSCYNNQLTNLNIKNGNNTAINIFNTNNNPNLTCIDVDNAVYSTANWTNVDTQTHFSENCSISQTYVPDDNFEQALIDLGYDTTLDDYVLTTNIASITSLDVSSKSISDLTGIEDFIALQSLQCANNGLSNLDITQNINLIDLRCYQNSLTSLDITQNTLLTELRCGTNSISSLDISQNTDLTSLRVQSNLLSAIDITLNTALTNLQCYNNDLNTLDLVQNTLLTDMNATLNTNLICIQVLDETAATANSGIYTTWLKDIGASYATNCNRPLETYVPDDNFEQALIDLGYDSILDDYVLTDNIRFLMFLDVSGKSISDLTGIEGFNNLSTLTCNSNNIQTLDLSSNISLSTINAADNQIDSINLQNIALLYTLNVDNNSLTDLNISQHGILSKLYCSSNQLTSLDISQNTSLKELYCNSNQLTSIDTSQNSYLTQLHSTDNSLTSLDITQNTWLTHLYCSDNLLTDLDVSQNQDLVTLECFVNNLTSLDVTLNEYLISLIAFSNSIEFLDLKQNTRLTRLNATSNATLSCIQVTNEADANAGIGLYALWLRDTGTSYSEFCSDFHTYVPDNNFEQALIDLGYDSLLDDYVLTANISNVSTLNVSFKSISDLTGIEAFAALTELTCSNNQITSLNITQNTSLTGLSCSTNLLTSLNVNSNTALIYLYCDNNLIENLDVTQNTELSILRCNNNQIASLNTSQNTVLTGLVCANNLLTEIDVSLNPYLNSFYCNDNQIANLDISSNTSMMLFECTNNELVSLNVKNGTNTNISTFNALNNPNLLCIEVDDTTYSIANWTDIDAQTSFSEDCSALSINELNENTYKVYPNPSSNIINIDSKTKIVQVELFDLLGKQIFSTKETSQIKINHIPVGMYFLKILSENGFVIKKIIIE